MRPAIRRAPLQSAQLLLARTAAVDAAKQRIAWTIIGQVSFNQGDFAAGRGRLHACAGARRGQRSGARRHHRAARRRGLQAGRRQAQCRRSGRRGRGFPARRARGAGLQDRRDRAIRCRGGADQRAAVGPGDRGAARPIGATIPKGEYSADVGRKLAVAYVAAGQRGRRRPRSSSASPPIRARIRPWCTRRWQGRGPVSAIRQYARAAWRCSSALVQRLSDAGAPMRSRCGSGCWTSRPSRGDSSARATGSARSCKADATAGAARTDRTKLPGRAARSWR